MSPLTVRREQKMLSSSIRAKDLKTSSKRDNLVNHIVSLAGLSSGPLWISTCGATQNHSHLRYKSYFRNGKVEVGLVRTEHGLSFCSSRSRPSDTGQSEFLTARLRLQVAKRNLSAHLHFRNFSTTSRLLLTNSLHPEPTLRRYAPTIAPLLTQNYT